MSCQKYEDLNSVEVETKRMKVGKVDADSLLLTHACDDFPALSQSPGSP
jgi:hypothetical protein